MKKETLLIVLVALLVVLNLGTLGFLLLGNSRHPHPPRPDKLIIERLELSQEQIVAFEALKKEHRSGINALNQQSKVLYQSYFAILKQDQPNLAQADSIEQLLAQVQAQKDSVTFDHFIKLRALCQPQQKPLFDGLVDELGDILVRQPPKR